MSRARPGPSSSSRRSWPDFAELDPGGQDRRRQRRPRPVPRCEAEAQAAFGERATASRSQPYYLYITNKDANKGAVVAYLSRTLGVPAEEIATIGDQPNDVLMFKRSGLSIAMGNASDRGQGAGPAVTDSYNDEGFAKAMERFILGFRG